MTETMMKKSDLDVYKARSKGNYYIALGLALFVLFVAALPFVLKVIRGGM